MPLTSKGEEIKHNMEKEYGKEHGERVFYASKNAGTISGVDSVPVGGCYGREDAEPEKTDHPPTSGVPQGRIYNSWGEYLAPAPGYEKPGPREKNHDQSWPPMDPTSIGAMPTMERGADASGSMGQPSGPQEPSDADPERLQFKSHEARNPVEERSRERERGEEAARRAGPTGPEVPRNKDAAPQPGEPGHEVRELEAMHSPASTFEDALFGGGRGHDYSRDATGLPQTVTHRQMQNFAAALNFGEGVTK